VRAERLDHADEVDSLFGTRTDTDEGERAAIRRATKAQ